MKMRKNRLLLERTVSREDVEFAAYSMSWQLVDQQAASASAPLRQVYRPPGSAGFVFYVEDAMLALRYLEADDNAVAALDDIREKLPTRDAQSVLDWLCTARTPDEIRLALRQAALIAPRSSDPQWFEATRPFFDHSHRGVRLTAVLVAAYLGWPEFMAILERLAASDPDIDVREDARTVLAGRLRGLRKVL